ncbi:MAG TPA: hypothetical protein PKE54_11310, partial [Candidatus Obscuribacter sp.]|nr:hypothetical protein [Candidatus Obscuribacter sp.]
PISKATWKWPGKKIDFGQLLEKTLLNFYCQRVQTASGSPFRSGNYVFQDRPLGYRAISPCGRFSSLIFFYNSDDLSQPSCISFLRPLLGDLGFGLEIGRAKRYSNKETSYYSQNNGTETHSSHRNTPHPTIILSLQASASSMASSAAFATLL